MSTDLPPAESEFKETDFSESYEEPVSLEKEPELVESSTSPEEMPAQPLPQRLSTRSDKLATRLLSFPPPVRAVPYKEPAVRRRERIKSTSDGQPGAPSKDLRISDKEILRVLKNSHGLQYLAADALGCSQANISQRLKANPALMEAWIAMKELVIDKSEKTVYEAIEEGNADMAIKHLERKAKNRGWTTSVLIGGDPERPLQLNITPILAPVLPTNLEREISDDSGEKED